MLLWERIGTGAQMIRRDVLVGVAALAVSTLYGPVEAHTMPGYVAAAVNDPNRPGADKMRDINRKPAESVAFAGVKPGDKVVDFLAGGGYFTRILSKVVGPQGHVYATAPGATMGGSTANMPMGGMAGGGVAQGGPMPMGRATPQGGEQMGGMGMADGLKAITSNTAYSNVSELMQSPSKLMVPEQVDVVWTAQNYHDLHNPGSYHADDIAAFNKSVFDALKPGGVFLVIDYVAAPGSGFTQSPMLHRGDPEATKAEILKAGFIFEGESNVLVRPNDPHTMLAHEQDDQFMFRFRKPK
jgi:predicted methyltransferase